MTCYSSCSSLTSSDYSLNFFAGFIVSFLVYWLLNKIWPVQATSDHWLEVGDRITDISLVYDDDENNNDDNVETSTYDEESGGSVKKYPVSVEKVECECE